MEYELSSEYTTRIEEDPRSPYRLAMIAAGISIVVIAVGLFIFANNTENREDFHGWYLLGFFISTVGFGAALGTKKFGLATLCALLLSGCMVVSLLKFDHRATISALVNKPGNESLLGDYVERLPPWEYDFLGIGNEPKWVKFDDECYRPILAQKLDSLPESCRTKESVQMTYNINLLALINARYALMRTTAQQINDKQITDKSGYESCVASGSCAEIPMLPIDAQVDQLTNASPEYRQIRNAFWQLIDADEMDASLCEFITLCKAMFQAGAVTRTDFESTKNTGTVPVTSTAPVATMGTPAPAKSATK